MDESKDSTATEVIDLAKENEQSNEIEKVSELTSVPKSNDVDEKSDAKEQPIDTVQQLDDTEDVPTSVLADSASSTADMQAVDQEKASPFVVHEDSDMNESSNSIEGDPSSTSTTGKMDSNEKSNDTTTEDPSSIPSPENNDTNEKSGVVIEVPSSSKDSDVISASKDEDVASVKEDSDMASIPNDVEMVPSPSSDIDITSTDVVILDSKDAEVTSTSNNNKDITDNDIITFSEDDPDKTKLQKGVISEDTDVNTVPKEDVMSTVPNDADVTSAPNSVNETSVSKDTDVTMITDDVNMALAPDSEGSSDSVDTNLNDTDKTSAPKDADMSEDSKDLSPVKDVDMITATKDADVVPVSEDIEMKDDSNDIIEVPQSSSDPQTSNKKETSIDNKEVTVNGNDDETAMEVENEENSSSAKLFNGGFGDDPEEEVEMTVQDALNYIFKKAEETIKDPNANPILVLNKKIQSLEQEIKAKSEEYVKINKVFESLYKDRVKFLRQVGVMPKLETKNVCIGVDFPWLPETVSGFFQNDLKTKSDNSSSNNGVTITAVNPKKDTGPIEFIDLTDDGDAPSSAPPKTTPASAQEQNNIIIKSSASTSLPKTNLHPAPLPYSAASSMLSTDALLQPRLKISVDKNGIVLQWDMPPSHPKHIKITGFEIYGYQERNTVPASSALWKKIGTVNPMPLPMSCTLTQFVEGFKYHFTIRAVSNDKFGLYSEPASIMFNSGKKN